ncbi:circularly permuted type 2 ATP-grasp protein [Cellulomonas soli]|uniref:circularly permuted type 2 ATP-grasp protein n=1 Tax=Cellulomonas soli TaxID=931535 RepID=UPI003F875A36
MTDLLSSPDVSLLRDGDGGLDLADVRSRAEQMLAERGVTYGTDADDDQLRAQPWRLDPAPVVVDEPEWARLDAALTQRAVLLDAVLRDVYGPRRLLTDLMLPPTVVLGHPGFVRAVDGLRLPGRRELVLTATDVCRDRDGRWTVVADRTQAPSGAGYAMEDRRVVAQVLSGVYRQTSIQRLGPFFHALRHALHDVAPPGVEDEPRAVLLSPGAWSETAFDQAYLASMLGLPLVEGSDLLVREGRLWMRGIDGLEAVDVVLRRVDADWCDPLDLRVGSRLGVPGFVRAVRAGAVSVVNPLGASVLESPALHAYLPRLAREVLADDLLLGSAPTWWCGDQEGLRAVRGRLDELVLLPTDHTGGAVAGWTLSAEQRSELAARIEAEPWRWVGQEPVVGDGGPSGAAPQAAVLRTFAVAHDESYTVMAGGLASVVEQHAGLVPVSMVSHSAGAVAKDVWVLARAFDADEAQDPDDAELSPSGAADAGTDRVRSGGEAPGRPASGISPRTAENLFWIGRYAERAEGQTRTLRVLVDRWDDEHRNLRTTGGRALTALVGALVPDELRHDGRPDLRALVLDPRTEDSVLACVRGLSRASGAVRDQLSSDVWGPLTRVERALRDERGRRPADQPLALGAAVDRMADVAERAALTAGLRPVLDRSLEGLLALAGITAESQVRDVGWRFWDAGRRLERAQRIVDTLAATLVPTRAPAVERLVLEGVALAHESAITYRRRHQAGPRVDTLLALLLQDADNPRSLAFQIDRLREDLAAVPAPRLPADQRDHLVADVAALVAELDVRVLAESVGEPGGPHARTRLRLAETLESMRWRLAAVGDEVERLHFVHLAPSRAFEATWGSA